MRRSLWFLFVLGSACGTPASDDTAESTDDASSSGSSGGDSRGPGEVDGATPPEASTGVGESTGVGDDDSTGDCDELPCQELGPTLLWSAVSDEVYGDGFCQSVTEDGAGGLFAAYLGYGWEAYSDVFAVDADGTITGYGRGLDAGTYVDLAPRGPGLFDWAAQSGQVGIADTSLTNLDGGMLGFDVDQIRAMVRGPDTLHYVARTTPAFACVVRVGTDASTDSLPFPCAPNFTEESLHIDGLGNRYYAEPTAYRILRIDPAGLLYGSVDGRWNRVGLDAAVDPDGYVWIVGAIGSEPTNVFGGFIARHDFDLSADPTFEDAAEGAIVWTSVAMTDLGPVVFGHEGYGEYMHARGYDFEGTQRWSWSQEVLPQTYVNELSVDADGNLLVCGFEYMGVQTPVLGDARHPLFMKFEL